jgi:hypothetical protein
VCRNIADGFGCESHKEFARFLEFSRRSLNEAMDCLRSAQLKGHVTQAELAPLQQLSVRLHPALSRFMAYLSKNPTRPADNRKEGRTDKRKESRNDKRENSRTDKREEDRTD